MDHTGNKSSLELSCEHDVLKIKSNLDTWEEYPGISQLSEWNGHRPQLSRLNNDTHKCHDRHFPPVFGELPRRKELFIRRPFCHEMKATFPWMDSALGSQ